MDSDQLSRSDVEEDELTDIDKGAKRQLVTDTEQFRKVLDRPYVAPRLSAHATSTEGGTPTSHYDYNFDEKDYKNRRKTSTKYHEPLRRIPTHHGDLSSYDKKSSKKHHKKKHKKDQNRDTKTQKPVNKNHEEEKAISGENPPQRCFDTVVLAEEIQNNVEINKASKIEEIIDFDKDSSKVPTEDDSEKFIALASTKEDNVKEADGGSLQYSEKEKKDVNEKASSVVCKEIDIPSTSESYVDGPSKANKSNDIQKQESLKREEVGDGKQIRKFVARDRESSFIDVMPKIKEHVELSFDAIKMPDDTDKDVAQFPSKDEPDFESHHREKVVSMQHLEKKGHKRHHHHHRRHRKHEVKQHRTISEREALAEKVRIRSGLLTLQETEPRVDDFPNTHLSGVEEEEVGNLEKKDLQEIAWHRFEDLRGLRRRRPHLRKPRLKSGMLTRQSSMDTLTVSYKQFPVKYDHSPHEAFIELQELTDKGDGMMWKETARWIKFEEDVEASNRWGKPHVASLTFHSLLELRKGLEKGTVLLDLEQFELQSIIETVVENMVITDQIPRSDKEMIIAALLCKHKHQYQQQNPDIPRRPSFYNLMSFAQNAPSKDENNSTFLLHAKDDEEEEGVIRLKIDEDFSDRSDNDGQKSIVPLFPSSEDDITTPKREVTFEPPKPVEKGTRKNESNVKSRIPADAEATAVMVGSLSKLTSQVLAFVRIAKGCYLGDLTEVDIPVRFIFVMLGPPDNSDTYYEIGRSISTLMSDQVFHDLAYYSESREDILHAINEFLDDTVVLPPGEWDRQLLVPLLMKQSKVMAKRRKEAKQISAIAIAAAEEEEDPLKRTGHRCGGLIRDIQRRAECYVSDFKDGFSLHSLWVTIFLYFSVFAPNIAFGGLLAEKTERWLGVSEVIFGTCICGILFGFFSGQPIIIIGATGPVLVFEQTIYQFCKQYGIEFLPWRFWIGTWVMIILLVVVIFEGCFLVRYFSRFTEEIFGCLISAIFIYEAINFLVKVFKVNPLGRISSIRNMTITGDYVVVPIKGEPNTALLSVILLFGTFFVAFYMQKVRHSHFFGKQMRRLISDLSIVIAMATMVVLDIVVGDKVLTPKIAFGNPFKEGFLPTLHEKRGWVINPIGLKEIIRPGWVFAAFVPAIFVGILLFMETELTGVLLNKKENCLRKLPGFNMDLVLMGVLTFICGIFGLPWMCAATVRSISHFSALSVWSTSHAPGERPFLVEVKEQRVTNIAIHVLTGFSILLAPVLNRIPVPVLFGVLLFLGVASLSHIQLVNRIIMLFMPPKHHPDVSYVRKVKTRTIYWFTAIQMLCLFLLMIVKLTDVAPAFPFFIICLIPLRWSLNKIFDEEELAELDNEEGESDDSDFDDMELLMHR